MEKIPDNLYLVSLDVRSLYTSILNSEGMKAAKTSLEILPRRTVATKVITAFLSLILTLKKFCIQLQKLFSKKGCAMGTIYAPAYTNIFVDHFERKICFPIVRRTFTKLLDIHGRYILYMDR